jgi:hypothetical protein
MRRHAQQERPELPLRMRALHMTPPRDPSWRDRLRITLQWPRSPLIRRRIGRAIEAAGPATPSLQPEGWVRSAPPTPGKTTLPVFADEVSSRKPDE